MPDAQQQLLDAAGKLTLAGLREGCRRVKAAAALDEDDRYRKIRRGRYCRSWTDGDGAVRLATRLTPDEGACVLAELDHRCAQIVAEARRGGWYENLEAHRADALVDVVLTCAGDEPAGPKSTVHVLVDYEALVRGHTVEGERCEIPGVGPIPVAVAERLAEDSWLKVLVAKGVDIEAVARRAEHPRPHRHRT